MWKKSLTYIFLIGILLLIGGLLFNPSLLVKLSRAGYFRSVWTFAQIHLIQSYIITFGLVFLLSSIIIGWLKIERKGSQFLLFVFLFGILLTLLAIILSPSFVENNFSPIGFLEDQSIAILKYVQLITISIGILIILIFSLVYRKKYLNQKKRYSLLIVVSVVVLYLILLDRTFIRLEYPSNILTQPKEFGKIFDLILGRDILLSDFEPKSTLIVKNKHIIKAKYPVIDINFHFNSQFQTDEDRKALVPENLVKSMDSINVRILVNTDGFVKNWDEYVKKYPDRFIVFCPSWFPNAIVTDDYLAQLPIELENNYKRGAKGDGEMWKYFGLKTRDTTGKIIRIDDPRIDPLWSKAGELGIPFLWHMGDPAGEFQPVNKYNERYIEIRRYPEWTFSGPRVASRESIMKGRENVLKKHPETIFIGCHMGWNTDNLAYAAYLLDTYPNYYLDLSTTISELGRQPFTARKFFIKYQDRILFGTDGGALFVKGWTVEKYYRTYFEFLETDNEYFKYPLQGAIDQGDWRIYGISLPDSALEKIYYKNAEKILKIKIQQ